MDSHDPFGHFKHKLWPKKGSGIKLAVWFPTIKSQESPRFFDFLACRWCATYYCKALDKGYNYAWDLISIKGLHTKLWAPKVTRVSILEISGLPLGSLGTKWHLGAGPIAKHKVYYKREGGGFPQVRVVVSLVNLRLPMVRPCTKVLQLCINQFVVSFV
jgi:hypothetical protein